MAFTPVKLGPDQIVVQPTPTTVETDPVAEADLAAHNVNPQAHRGLARIGNKVAALGDSITIGGSNSDNVTSRADYLGFASMYSDGRIIYWRNSGITGNKASDMLARLQTDIVAFAPHWCIVMSGTNDASGAVTQAAYATNIIAIVAALRAAGIQPVLMVSPPLPAGTQRITAAQYAAWIRAYAFREGVPLIDARNLFMDPATGGYKAQYDSGDGIHPNQTGYRDLGSLVATQLAPLLPPHVPQLSDFATGQEYNIVPNSLGLAGAFPGTSWSKSGLGTGSFVSDANALGNWWRLTDTTNEQTTVEMAAAVTTGFAVGDKLMLSARFQSDNTSGTVSVYVFFQGANKTYRVVGVQSVATPAHTVYGEYTVPTGTTGVKVGFQIQSGTGMDARIAQPSLINLTALGLS